LTHINIAHTTHTNHQDADNENQTPKHIGIEEDMATQALRHLGKPSTHGDTRTDAVLAVGGRDRENKIATSKNMSKNY